MEQLTAKSLIEIRSRHYKNKLRHESTEHRRLFLDVEVLLDHIEFLNQKILPSATNLDPALMKEIMLETVRENCRLEFAHKLKVLEDAKR